MNDVIDADARPLAVRDEVEIVTSQNPLGMLDASTPEEFLERLERVCTPLVKFIRTRKLSKKLGSGNKEHVELEAWQFLAAMPWVRCNAVVEWTREFGGDGSGLGWEARAVCYRDGQVVGAGEGACLREEGNWRRKDYFSLKSMAQTRAMSRAYQGPLRFIFVAGGYAGAGAEEMPDFKPPGSPGFAASNSAGDGAKTRQKAKEEAKKPTPEAPPAGDDAHAKGVAHLMILCRERNVSDEARYAMSRKLFAREHTADLTMAQLRELYHEIKAATDPLPPEEPA